MVEVRTLVVACKPFSPGHRRRFRDVCRMVCWLYNSQLAAFKAWSKYAQHRGDWKRRPAGDETARDPFAYFSLTRDITARKQRNPELGTVAVGILRGSARRFARMRKLRSTHYGKTGNPARARFKASARWHTLTLDTIQPNHVTPPNEGGKWWRITIKGLPTIKFKDRQNRIRGALGAGGKIKEIRIADRRRLEAHLVIATPKPAQPKPAQPVNALGIDPGVKHAATLCNGETIPAPPAEPKRIKQTQRKMSRAVRGSGNYRRLRASKARQQHDAKTSRRHRLHRITTALVRAAKAAGHDAIAWEDLTQQPLMSHGGNHKRAFNRKFAMNGIHEIKTMAAYKAESAGMGFVLIAPHNTTRTCSACGHVQDVARSAAVYECGHCSASLDRDQNAAQNVCQAANGGRRCGYSHKMGADSRAETAASCSKHRHNYGDMPLLQTKVLSNS